ncbi:MAG: hypothetical protein K0Q89_10 [Thermomicrobiales bacterium]|jgi:hypothetical protein|nr:hypothetical protein [Thermomicrobiales bacterium]
MTIDCSHGVPVGQCPDMAAHHVQSESTCPECGGGPLLDPAPGCPCNTWPVCPARITSGAVHYTCDLPARHFHDGSRDHHDPSTDRVWNLQWMVSDA